MLLYQRRLEAVVNALAAQGVLLGLAAAWQGWVQGAPQLYLAPSDSPWLDVIVGLPTSRQLFCLRAGEKTLPPAHHIPFNLPDTAMAASAVRWQRAGVPGLVSPIPAPAANELPMAT